VPEGRRPAWDERSSFHAETEKDHESSPTRSTPRSASASGGRRHFRTPRRRGRVFRGARRRERPHFFHWRIATRPAPSAGPRRPKKEPRPGGDWPAPGAGDEGVDQDRGLAGQGRQARCLLRRPSPSRPLPVQRQRVVFRRPAPAPASAAWRRSAKPIARRETGRLTGAPIAALDARAWNSMTVRDGAAPRRAQAPDQEAGEGRGRAREPAPSPAGPATRLPPGRAPDLARREAAGQQDCPFLRPLLPR